MTASDPLRKEYLNSFSDLKKEIKSRGFYQRDTKKILAHLLFHYCCLAVGIALFLNSDNYFVALLSIIIWLQGLMGIGTHTHNSAHHTSTSSHKADQLLSYLGYSTTLGLSTHYWQHKHNIVHHKYPNIIELDQDHDLMPWFALTDYDKEGVQGIRLTYYNYFQGIALPLIMVLNMFNLQRAGLVYLYDMFKNGKLKKGHCIDIFCYFLHLMLWIGIPSIWYEIGDVILFYLLSNALLSYAMFFVLGASHLVAEACCVVNRDKEADYFLSQTATTINIDTNRYGRILYSGLDYQIEHHLFPGVCYTKLPQVSKLVKEYCQANNYPHKTLSLWHSIVGVASVFYKPKQVLQNFESERLNTQ